MEKSIQVFAPATVANVSAGYDILGFALNQPGDEVILRLNQSGKVTLDEITGDEGKLPLDPEKNVVSAVVIKYLKERNLTHLGASISLHKKMPFGSGLGSSSASSVAGLYAINQLMENPLEKIDLLPLAMGGERIACGNAHADNVAPSLLGGLVLIRSYHPLDVIPLHYPKNLYVSLVYPHVDIPTGEARKIISQRVALRDAVTQWGNVAGLVTGFITEDLDLIERSMKDVIFEPVRSVLIHYFYYIREIALENGAIGFGISGSGPTVFSICKDEQTARKVTEKVREYLRNEKVESNGYISPINPDGVKVIGRIR